MEAKLSKKWIPWDNEAHLCAKYIRWITMTKAYIYWIFSDKWLSRSIILDAFCMYESNNLLQ